MHPIELLRDWFLENKREFPWRDKPYWISSGQDAAKIAMLEEASTLGRYEKPSPYEVWVSEVMLQQTQAATVVPYFLRWMEKFPDVASLAKAPVEEVVKMWEGLGYYARARRLHAGAQQVILEFGGDIPDTEESLMRICGIGPYTCGAILSFAFHKKAAAVDGNVGRVLSRYRGIGKPLSQPAAQKMLRKETMDLLPDERAWEVMEGLIELGATLCRPKSPLCHHCPLQESCWALKHDEVARLPIKEKRASMTPLFRAVFVLIHKGCIALQQGTEGSIMEGLYEFPYVDLPEKVAFVDHSRWQPKEWSVEKQTWEVLPAVTHTFTRFKATLFPALTTLGDHQKPLEPYQWIPFARIATLPFSSGHRKILLHSDVQKKIFSAS